MSINAGLNTQEIISAFKDRIISKIEYIQLNKKESIVITTHDNKVLILSACNNNKKPVLLVASKT